MKQAAQRRPSVNPNPEHPPTRMNKEKKRKKRKNVNTETTKQRSKQYLKKWLT